MLYEELCRAISEHEGNLVVLFGEGNWIRIFKRPVVWRLVTDKKTYLYTPKEALMEGRIIHNLYEAATTKNLNDKIVFKLTSSAFRG